MLPQACMWAPWQALANTATSIQMCYPLGVPQADGDPITMCVHLRHSEDSNRGKGKRIEAYSHKSMRVLWWWLRQMSSVLINGFLAGLSWKCPFIQTLWPLVNATGALCFLGAQLLPNTCLVYIFLPVCSLSFQLPLSFEESEFQNFNII